MAEREVVDSAAVEREKVACAPRLWEVSMCSEDGVPPLPSQRGIFPTRNPVALMRRFRGRGGGERAWLQWLGPDSGRESERWKAKDPPPGPRAASPAGWTNERGHGHC